MCFIEHFIEIIIINLFKVTLEFGFTTCTHHADTVFFRLLKCNIGNSSNYSYVTTLKTHYCMSKSSYAMYITACRRCIQHKTSNIQFDFISCSVIMCGRQWTIQVYIKRNYISFSRSILQYHIYIIITYSLNR